MFNAEVDLNGNRRDYVIVVFWMLLRYVILGLLGFVVFWVEIANGTDEMFFQAVDGSWKYTTLIKINAQRDEIE